MSTKEPAIWSPRQGTRSSSKKVPHAHHMLLLCNALDADFQQHITVWVVENWKLYIVSACAADFFEYAPPGGSVDVGYDYT